tara:strand:- start:1206 stop:1526 length:321 start_codon:yes stop_codon:yes gene_type:complete
MSDYKGTPYMTNLETELKDKPTLLSTIVALIDEALYEEYPSGPEGYQPLQILKKLVKDAQTAADKAAQAEVGDENVNARVNRMERDRSLKDNKFTMIFQRLMMDIN